MESFTELRDRLNEYFDSDLQKRFQLQGAIGKGSYSIAWKLSYQPKHAIGFPNASGSTLAGDRRYIVLKTEKAAFMDPSSSDSDSDVDMLSSEGRDSLEDEKRWMRVALTTPIIYHLEEINKTADITMG